MSWLVLEVGVAFKLIVVSVAFDPAFANTVLVADAFGVAIDPGIESVGSVREVVAFDPAGDSALLAPIFDVGPQSMGVRRAPCGRFARKCRRSRGLAWPISGNCLGGT